ncbi:carbohydrate ABC transporter permease [Paenibacillus hemerocallicola]|uniref:Carbohydrate ABC transporter permease n=1 Tax=Paenibacillus hemerocallicola TaxID=1172614 RepID=A0A5C4TBG3_9BACL|nr:carbohydrate ABC transporter permease [Paenibacillus hemerocallicola]TNJ66414.1 carbohydrate ABC transporter permease [Paenibacillus hemerocallicola]
MIVDKAELMQTVRRHGGGEPSIGRTVGKRAKLLLLGRDIREGLIYKFFLYWILTNVAVLYMRPFLYMVSTMFKSKTDLIDPTVQWIPIEWDASNVWFGLEFMKYALTGLHSLTIAGGAAVLQVLSCSLTGYALARLRFPLRGLWFFLVLLTFLIPPQTILIPLYMLYQKLEMLRTPLPFLVPALFGQGLKGALFVIIFRQFFRTLPKELEEAARIDGASALRLFVKVMLPLARPAILVVFLFSFVWHWNDTYLPSLFLGKEYATLPLQLDNLQSAMGDVPGYVDTNITEQVYMAASFWFVAPPLLLYLIAQKWFVQGVERTGIVE